MSILHKTARQSSSLAFLWRGSSLAQIRTFSIGAYNFKKDTLKSAPGWDGDNATESEADVKADREPLPKDVEELQKNSIESLAGSNAAPKQHGNFVNRSINGAPKQHGNFVNHSSNANGKKVLDVDDHVDADKGA
ncbi:hypothetical protein BGZ74_007359 [Mortierella antarctica]|nr:hypothetical protein BGZ74_007359 [Mortierella antarctica]